MNIVTGWRNIPEYDGKYQASFDGQIQRVYKSGTTRLMTPYKKSSKSAKRILRNRLFVKLTKDGKSKEVPMLKIMVATYYGSVPQGKVPYHKDGSVTNNEAGNVGFIDKKTLGQKTGAISRRKPVAKTDRTGETIAFYSSAREAAKHNHMSYQTVLDRCHNKVKRPFELDGYNYQFDV